MRKLTNLVALASLLGAAPMGSALSAQPAPPAAAKAPQSSGPATDRSKDKVATPQILAVTAALAGLAAFTAIVTNGNSSRPRPTSP